jgi:hypothetical protein
MEKAGNDSFENGGRDPIPLPPRARQGTPGRQQQESVLQREILAKTTGPACAG